MKKSLKSNFYTLIFLSSLTMVISGCKKEENLPVSPTPTQTKQIEANKTKTMKTPSKTQTQTLSPKVTKKAENEKTEAINSLKEIENPNFELPNDIHTNQIIRYYKTDKIYLALVQKPSANVYLENIPKNFDTEFAGLLIAENNSGSWSKLLTIKDKETNKNNPYHLWSEKNKFFLAIIDQNGAGSGEGFLKLFSSKNLKDWSFEECRYFIPEKIQKFSTEQIKALSKLEIAENLNCKNLELET